MSGLSAVLEDWSASAAMRRDVRLAPSFEYDVAIGGAIGYLAHSRRGYQPDDTEVTYDVSDFSAHARLRFHHAFSSDLSWFPSIGVGFSAHSYDEYSERDRNEQESISARMVVAAPLLVHVASHYFMGIGPELTRDLSNNKTENLGTLLGLSSSAGGWF